MDKFEQYLKSDVSDEILFSNYRDLVLHKEKYDDRFTVIYGKRLSKGLKQEDYSVFGYYDNLEKTLYDYSYELTDFVKNLEEVKISSFSELGRNMFKEINQYVEKVVLNDRPYYRDLGKEKYDNLEDWKVKSVQLETHQNIINNNEIPVSFKSINSGYEIGYKDVYSNKSIFVDYLNNPTDVIKKYGDDLIQEHKEDLGVNLLIYEYQCNYFEEIIKNKDNKFDYIFISRKILNSIKDIDAKTLNITISYDDEELSFKYDYYTLKRDLENGDCKTETYGSSYNMVKEFLKAHNVKDERDYIEDEFRFDHITSITYGKKLLYEKETLSKDLEKENDDFEFER